VLNAAALTYVAAAIQALSTLLYYGMLLTGHEPRLADYQAPIFGVRNQ
jgi:hypothetical protein